MGKNSAGVPSRGQKSCRSEQFLDLLQFFIIFLVIDPNEFPSNDPRAFTVVIIAGSVVYQFYGPSTPYDSLLLDGGDVNFIRYDEERFNLVVKKPLYDRLVRGLAIIHSNTGENIFGRVRPYLALGQLRRVCVETEDRTT